MAKARPAAVGRPRSDAVSRHSLTFPHDVPRFARRATNVYGLPPDVLRRWGEEKPE